MSLRRKLNVLAHFSSDNYPFFAKDIQSECRYHSVRMNVSYFLTVTALALSAISAEALAPSITNGPPASPAGVNAPYSFTYAFTGSPTPTFSVISGALPTGLSLSPTGAISGTPTLPAGTTSATYTGTVQADNGLSPAATQSFSIIVATVVNTVPEGVVSFNFPATDAGQTSVNYYSSPLLSDPVYTGAVSAVTATSISTANSPFVNTTNGTQLASLATAATPYFVKFLSGLQAGRVILVTANTANTLTLDTSDHSSQTVPLNLSSPTNFSVAVNDSFEVFAGDTLGSIFGVNTQAAPLVLKGGTSILSADSVSIYDPARSRFESFYFDTAAGFWKHIGTMVNANNTIIYPYSTFAITRRPNEAASSLVLMGRVAEVSRLIKTSGSATVIYDSTGYPIDMKLSDLVIGNWTRGSTVLNSDTLSVWDAALSRFDTFFQLSTDGTWRKSGGGSADQSSFVIPAGTTVSFLKRAAVSGSTSYLKPTLPYRY
jgi:uncharacterized protein (TIGR02597 family)